MGMELIPPTDISKPDKAIKKFQSNHFWQQQLDSWHNKYISRAPIIQIRPTLKCVEVPSYQQTCAKSKINHHQKRQLSNKSLASRVTIKIIDITSTHEGSPNQNSWRRASRSRHWLAILNTNNRYSNHVNISRETLLTTSDHWCIGSLNAINPAKQQQQTISTPTARQDNASRLTKKRMDRGLNQQSKE